MQEIKSDPEKGAQRLEREYSDRLMSVAMRVCGDAAIKMAVERGFDCHYASDVVTAEMVAEVRKAGYEFHVWTVDKLGAIAVAATIAFLLLSL